MNVLTVVRATSAAFSGGYPYTPVLMQGKAYKKTD
jgi:hypothetical protein